MDAAVGDYGILCIQSKTLVNTITATSASGVRCIGIWFTDTAIQNGRVKLGEDNLVAYPYERTPARFIPFTFGESMARRTTPRKIPPCRGDAGIRQT